LSPEDLGAVLPLVLIAVVFWLLILRPARRKQQEAARLQRGLGVGDRVMLTSGMFGTVRRLEDETFDVEVAAGVVVTVHRQAVARIVVSAAEDTPGEPTGQASEADGDGGERRP